MAISQGYAVDQMNPSGAVQMYAGANAPPGWLVCDGSAVSRSLYSNLFNIIGTTYGSGDGTTTFNLPNLKSNVPVGYNAADPNFNVLGKTGGEATHTLTIAETPTHTHEIVVNSDTSNGLVGLSQAGGNSGDAILQWSSGTIAGGLWATDTGGGGSHNNLQPYIALNFIIKL